MNNPKTKKILMAIFDIIIGILLLVGGASAFNKMMSIIITVYAIYLIVMGAMSIAKNLLVPGIVMILAGVLLLCIGWTSIAWVATLLLGIYLLIISIYSFIKVPVFELSSIMSCLLGVLLLLIAFGNNFAWTFANIFFYIAGALIIVRGVLQLFEKR